MEPLLNEVLIVDSIMSSLSASDASSIVMTDKMIMKYINSIRDVPEHEDWINTMIADGNLRLMVDKDAVALKQRIMNPETYWKLNPKKPTLSTWIMATSKITLDDHRDPSYRDQGMWPKDSHPIEGMCSCCNQQHPDPAHTCPNTARFKIPKGLLRGCGYTRQYTSTLAKTDGINVYFYVPNLRLDSTRGPPADGRHQHADEDRRDRVRDWGREARTRSIRDLRYGGTVDEGVVRVDIPGLVLAVDGVRERQPRSV